MRGDPKVYPARIEKKLVEDVERSSAIFEVDASDRAALVPSRIYVRLETAGLSADGDSNVPSMREVPPPSQRLALIVEANQWGHFAVHGTRERLINSFKVWWIGMDADIAKVIGACEVCNKDASHRAVWHATIDPHPSKRFRQGSHGLAELTRHGGWFDGVVALRGCTLEVSHMPQFPLKSKDMNSIAECLWKVIAMFGVPTVIHLDNGAEFVNSAV